MESCAACGRADATRGYCPFCNASRPRCPQQNNNRLMERVEKYNDPEAYAHWGTTIPWGNMNF
eukprot:scaffold30539_cov33-Cyclotella_meneghiniana.AAC.3